MMAIKKGKHLSTLSNKEFQRKRNRRKANWSYEGGIDPQQDQLNEVPKNTEEWQNVDQASKLNSSNKPKGDETDPAST
ncbi:hypothetical protein GCM10023231_21230 [Olivibacter ginsenosidimutans]|uniref:Uncharacterized protein n=1 Tax=Olivibacter ginsenosidimutans TaxID=1176537 RepID=A0ABP9BAF3_9SPHI